MATLQVEDGPLVEDSGQISEWLQPLGVTLRVCPPQAGASGERASELSALLDRPALDEAERERTLALLDASMAAELAAEGIVARDLVVLHPALQGLSGILEPFSRCHRHSDFEIRWVIEGEGVFGFVPPNGPQLALKVRAGDFIRVPAGVEHWFVLCTERRIKAVRYFTDRSGWVANHTGTPVRVQA